MGLASKPSSASSAGRSFSVTVSPTLASASLDTRNHESNLTRETGLVAVGRKDADLGDVVLNASAH